MAAGIGKSGPKAGQPDISQSESPAAGKKKKKSWEEGGTGGIAGKHAQAFDIENFEEKQGGT